jgi:serine/threonine protein kinase
MAPEILLANKKLGTWYLGPSVDIWSAGISLYIMLSGNLPFDINDISEEVKNGKYFNGEYNNNILLKYCILNFEPKKIDDISDLAQDFLKKILNKNPKKRLTCEQILSDPWIYFDDNHKYHLFTKAEMIMLSKTFIDYRYSKSEDLLESFTISNLINETNKTDKDKNIDNNIETKSSIFTPYNSAIVESSIISNKIDDVKNSEILFNNNYIIFSNKAKELNMIYELNNNEEIDNGILINSKTNSTSSNKLNNSKDNDYSQNVNIKSANNKLHINNKNNNICNNKEKSNHILDSIESMGYDRQYAVNIINNNELSQIYAIFFC